jgi:hypothetical protein
MRLFEYTGGNRSSKTPDCSGDQSQRQEPSDIKSATTSGNDIPEESKFENPRDVNTIIVAVHNEHGLNPAWKNLEWWQASMVMIVRLSFSFSFGNLFSCSRNLNTSLEPT